MTIPVGVEETMTPSEKMIWAAAYIHALNGFKDLSWPMAVPGETIKDKQTVLKDARKERVLNAVEFAGLALEELREHETLINEEYPINSPTSKYVRWMLNDM